MRNATLSQDLLARYQEDIDNVNAKVLAGVEDPNFPGKLDRLSAALPGLVADVAKIRSECTHLWDDGSSAASAGACLACGNPA